MSDLNTTFNGDIKTKLNLQNYDICNFFMIVEYGKIQMLITEEKKNLNLKNLRI